MSYLSISLVTDEVPVAELSGDHGNVPVIHFRSGYGGTFDVTLPFIPAVEQAAWLRNLAERVSDLAIRIERRAVTA